MQATEFLLLESESEQEREIILPGTGLRIRFFNLDTDPFTPDPAQLQFYGQYQGRTIAFQAPLNHDPEHPDYLEDIAAGITWYAELIGNPHMDITVDPPTAGPRCA